MEQWLYHELHTSGFAVERKVRWIEQVLDRFHALESAHVVHFLRQRRNRKIPQN